MRIRLNKKGGKILYETKKAVDNINELELKYIGYSTGYSITTVAALSELGLTGSALNCLIKLETQQKNALYYYFRV